jgi:hypothetical protein
MLQLMPEAAREAAPKGDASASVSAGSPLCRLVLSVVSLLAFTTGMVGFASGVGWIRLVGLSVFFVVGVGAAPWQVNDRLSTYERLVLTFVTAIGVMVLGSLLMTSLHAWYPKTFFVALMLGCLPPHIIGFRRSYGVIYPVRRAIFDPIDKQKVRFSAHHRRIIIEGLPAIAPALAGVVLCLLTAFNHRHLDPGFYGFLPQIGFTWYVGLVFILVGIGLGVAREHSRPIPVFCVLIVLTLTPAITYGLPRSQSAAKHVDFILQIQSLGELNSSVQIYNAYAGFFAAMAWFCSVTGISDPIRLATFWPTLLGIFRVIVLRYLAGQVLAKPLQCWIAVTLAVLADSIGSDYFSPQSVGFVLGMATIGVALTANSDVPRLPILLFAGLTLAVSHQLSPFMIGGVFVILVLFRQLSPPWVPLLILGPALLWAFLHWSTLNDFFSLESLGRLGNFRPPETSGSPQLERLPVVRESVVAQLVAIGLVGLLAGVTLLRNIRDRRSWAFACCSGVGLVIVAINPYGQEGIFRAALFGLPWLALLASGFFCDVDADVADARFREHWRNRILLIITTTCLVTTYLVASTALDAMNVIRRADLAAVRYFRQQGGPRPPDPYYMLLLTTGDLPTSPDVEDGKHAIWGRDVIDFPVRQQPTFDPQSEMLILTDRFVRYTARSPRDDHLFALWSPVGSAYAEAYAIQSSDQSAALRDAFRAAPFWSVRTESDGTLLLEFQRARYRGGTG